MKRPHGYELSDSGLHGYEKERMAKMGMESKETSRSHAMVLYASFKELRPTTYYTKRMTENVTPYLFSLVVGVYTTYLFYMKHELD